MKEERKWEIGNKGPKGATQKHKEKIRRIWDTFGAKIC